MRGRTRSYRRFIEEVKVIKRLRHSSYKYDVNICVNDMWVVNPLWVDFISSKSHYKFRTITTDVLDTRYKMKWGLKSKIRKRAKYCDRSDPKTRTKDKKRFKKQLENEGYKHLPSYTQYQSELDC